ncbi:MAG TPA: ShlB/FhaC/HecB family hemolysin secretion/activation protein, partial [Steroidobacter sp.]|nr:ShlB/FhaC/HecB family hemolysin secretion/activation protein [Steroidobacter sp.]
MRNHHDTPVRLLSLALALAAPAAFAQQVPDAGRILQQQREQPEAPVEADGGFDIEQPVTSPVASGGPKVAVAGIDIDGATVFTPGQLLAVIGDPADKEYDLAGLHALAERITRHYRLAGYPFARAYLPAQRSSDGRVRIEVVEGRYGELHVQGEETRLNRAAEAYLRSLTPGEIIATAPLERAVLLLQDLPGVAVTSVVRPGGLPGAGDLTVSVERDERLLADLTMDNHGNRYSGEHRLGGTLAWLSPLLAGDQLLLQGMVGEQDLRVGSIDYSLPIGSSGLRMQTGYAYTQYELGEDFAVLGAAGRARIASVGMSYPVLRSHRANLTVQLSYQHKALEDRFSGIGVDEHKHSHVMPVAIKFDWRDAVGGGGLSYGALSYTRGELHLGESLRAFDAASVRTRGGFDKVNVDLARLQNLTGAFSLYASVSAQWANNNLDSSESFGLGGVGGVRAFPTGEAFGDEGWLGRVELRYAHGALQPYVFFDHGKMHVNARPGKNVENRSEERNGTGLGMRWRGAQWRLDAVLAWRTSGDAPASDSRDPQPRPWLD